MPRMWSSPSPRTLSQTPCRISVRSWNGSSGFRLSLSVNFVALLVGPERRGDDAVGAEHDDQPLLAPLLVGEAQARQVQDERQGRRADAQVADELASVAFAGPCQSLRKRVWRNRTSGDVNDS